MRILYHHRIASKDGQYVHIEELTKALQEAGHDIVMVGPKVLGEAAYGYDSGLVYLLKRLIPRLVYEVLEFSYSLVAYARLAKELRRHRPDIVYERYNLFFPAGVWAAKRAGIPILLEVNAPLFDERSRHGGISLKRLARWSEQYVWRNADALLPVTRVLADMIARAGVAEDRITVIPNGIDRDRFLDPGDRERAKANIGLQGNLVLGFTGFVRPWHGLDKVLRFIANAPQDNLHLLLVGDGPHRVALQLQASQLGIENQITVTGFVDRDTVSSLIAAFDIALQPDVVGYASPLKLFEYMGAGCAILAPRKRNIQEVLSHDVNGLLFDADEQESLFENLSRLCRDEPLRRRLAEAARKTVEQRDLTWQSNARRVREVAGAVTSNASSCQVRN